MKNTVSGWFLILKLESKTRLNCTRHMLMLIQSHYNQHVNYVINHLVKAGRRLKHVRKKQANQKQISAMQPPSRQIMQHNFLLMSKL